MGKKGRTSGPCYGGARGLIILDSTNWYDGWINLPHCLVDGLMATSLSYQLARVVIYYSPAIEAQIMCTVVFGSVSVHG
jgi:hypothetical protein